MSYLWNYNSTAHTYDINTNNLNKRNYNISLMINDSNIKSNIFHNKRKYMFNSNKDIINVNYLHNGIYFIEVYIDNKRYKAILIK